MAVDEVATMKNQILANCPLRKPLIHLRPPPVVSPLLPFAHTSCACDFIVFNNACSQHPGLPLNQSDALLEDFW